MRTLINDGWSFVKLHSGSTYAEAENAVFEPVDLPHDWLIWQEDNLYETADAWYKRNIHLPEGHDPVVMIRFDGVYMDCDILLNGETICTHPYGYTAFDVPLTGKLKPGQNLLMVHIRHHSPNSRWYSGSGIFRDVTLVTLPIDHMIPDSLYLTESKTEETWYLNVSAEITGDSVQQFCCKVSGQNDGNMGFALGTCKAGKAEATVVIPQGRTWSPEDPYLYDLTVTYGEHTETIKIGLRSVCITPDRGMLLNGTHIKLKGVCLHHDLGALGAAFNEKAARRQLTLMKKMGANAIRTSHNPPAAALLDLCDEMGLLVVDEAFDMWERAKTAFDYARFFPQWSQKDVASWIRRDRCHPCVIMWSIGNEIYDIHAGYRGTEVTRMLTEQVRIHDPSYHAYTTFGCNYMPWQGGQRCAEYVDAVGYNYGETLYENHHNAHPSWVIYGSETASILSSRGIYHFPIEQSIMSDSDMQCSALGNSNTSWGAESMQEILSADLLQQFSLGQFLWSGIDYIGEPTPYHTRSCYFGQADTACFPKDAFYLVQCFWTDQKLIHIGVYWDWNPGQIIDVPVITNCDRAELFLNGESLGEKRTDLRNPNACMPTWKIPYMPGTLRAVGYDSAGSIQCEDIRITPGDTSKLILTSEDPYLVSDGYDMTFVTVSAADREGRPVDNARNRLKVSVSGGGRLIGTDNGDSTDPDGYKSDCRRLFSGKLLLMIASNGHKEDIIVSVQSADGMSAELMIPVVHADVRPGISFVQHAYRRTLPDMIQARKVLIEAIDSVRLTKENPMCRFRYSVLPENTTRAKIEWQVTNAAGIESPFIELEETPNVITVRASGDGDYYLRALCMEGESCLFISQLEFSVSGLGSPALDPYKYVSAGLYDLHEGDIGAGNEKGVAFSREGESMIGFSFVDFGKAGSDRITADIFALNDDPYDLELFVRDSKGQSRQIAVLHYQKPSIWNVYQAETWELPERLYGVQTLLFRMNQKIHLKGFKFERQTNAYITHTAGSADSIYGDTYTRNEETISGIGNNVTLSWNEMEFGTAGDMMVEICGKTPLPVNTVHIRIRNERGEETISAAEFQGNGEVSQQFSVSVPEGICTVSFVFLPGSSFDFCSYRFHRTDNWTEQKD